MTVNNDSITPVQVAKQSLSGFIATGFGSGLSSFAPGTVGSLVALLPAYLYVYYFPNDQVLIGLLLVVAAVVGIWACGRAGQLLKQHDHPSLVWDEFLGQWLVLLVVPVTWLGWLSAFLLFRLFDITKPWPVKVADQHIHGGVGVMLDDVLAAAYAVLVLLLLQYLWPGLLLH